MRGTTITLLLLNEVRHRIIARLFGMSRADSNLLTVFAVGSLAGGLAAGAARMRNAAVRPSVAGTAIGAAVLKESAHGIAGEWSRTTPFFAGLVALVVVEKSFGPTLRGSFRAVRGTFRGIAAVGRRARDFVAAP